MSSRRTFESRSTVERLCIWTAPYRAFTRRSWRERMIGSIWDRSLGWLARIEPGGDPVVCVTEQNPSAAIPPAKLLGVQSQEVSAILAVQPTAGETTNPASVIIR